MKTIEEKELVVPIRFPIKTGKFSGTVEGGIRGVVRVRTRGPIAIAYYLLALKMLIMGTRKALSI